MQSTPSQINLQPRFPSGKSVLEQWLYKMLLTSHVDPDCIFSHIGDSIYVSCDITEAGDRMGRADHSLLGQEIPIPYLGQRIHLTFHQVLSIHPRCEITESYC